MDFMPPGRVKEIRCRGDKETPWRACSPSLACLFVIAPLLGPVSAADVLEQVPSDALGVVVVRQLSSFDVNTSQMLRTTWSQMPGPLAALRSVLGVGPGLDQERDVLLVVLPPERDSERHHLAVWLPVSDYEAFVRSLDGDPQRRMAAVTVAGEDLLVVRHSDWAVVMDPDQRERLTGLDDAETSPPPQLANWESWVNTNDVSILVLSAGMRSGWQFASESSDSDASAGETRNVGSTDDLFGPAAARPSTGVTWPVVQQTIRELFADSPGLRHLLGEAKGAGCGLRLDRDGNVAVGLRIEFSDAQTAELAGAEVKTKPLEVPQLYHSGRFVFNAMGTCSPRWTVPFVAPYVRQVVKDLSEEYGNQVDSAKAAKFRDVLEHAVTDVGSFALLTRPGAGDEGVFTNNFLVVRVPEAKAFLKRAADVVQQWNAMLDEAPQGIRLVFQSKPVTIGALSGTEYSIDVGEAVGAPAMGIQAMPEFRRSMERLFGPGGKFHMLFIAVDDQTVMLAAATKDQTDQAIKEMSAGGPPSDEHLKMHKADRLLSEGADWRLYVNLHDYNRWLERQMDAVLGPVIGGPVVRKFRETPPVAFVGGTDAQFLWCELAVPVETLHALRVYVQQ